MTEKLLNESDYKQILERCFKRDNLKFISSTIEPLSENVEGYLGEHYKMVVTFKDGNIEQQENFFIKTKPMKNKSQLQVLNEFSFFEIEIFMYNCLISEFEKLGFDTSFAANCYYCVPGTTMVMENLNEKGFVLRKKREWYSLIDCQCGLKSLARLHAASYAYEAIKSKETGKPFSFLKEHPTFFEEHLFTQCMDVSHVHGPEQWLNSSLVMCKAMVDHLPKPQDYKAEFKRRLETVKLGDIFVQKTNIKRAIGHGDLWSNNMFFKQENNITTRCVLVDYQLMRYFYPAYDVMDFIYSNTTVDFRLKHFEQLKNFYYDFLTDTLKSYGYSVEDFYPRNDYERSLRISDFSAMFQVFATHALVFLPNQLLNKDMMEEGDTFKDLLFQDRLTTTLEAFERDAEYRNIIIEEMDQLFKILENDCID